MLFRFFIDQHVFKASYFVTIFHVLHTHTKIEILCVLFPGNKRIKASWREKAEAATLTVKCQEKNIEESTSTGVRKEKT